MHPYAFFLGGADLEMETIRQILESTPDDVRMHDKHLAWGAKASMYREEIWSASRANQIPVLVELELDIDLPEGSVIIDHHNEFFHRPASILQVCELLGREPNRHELLVAANDSGYIPSLIAFGATQDEIERIRSLDRSCQGVTPEMEEQAEQAIKRARRSGSLVIVEIPHNKASAVTDRLFSSWPGGKENLLVVCAGGQEAYYFGRGDIALTLKEDANGFGGGSGFGEASGNAFAGIAKEEDVPGFVNLAIKLASAI